MTKTGSGKVRIAPATQADRPSIYRMRHDVYAVELGQHQAQQDGMLFDVLDEQNVYIIAEIAGSPAGFISITLPGIGRYSIEKYLSRDELPVKLDEQTYEVRILTVARDHRQSRVAWYLMYAAFRWVEEHGGELRQQFGAEKQCELVR